MTDLLEKLEAAIGRTERIAREATGGIWWWAARAGKAKLALVTEDDQTVLLVASADMFPSKQDASHIVLNNPERVLRRVARDRKLLELAKVLREDGQDNAADYLLQMLAEDYEIEVQS